MITTKEIHSGKQLFVAVWRGETVLFFDTRKKFIAAAKKSAAKWQRIKQLVEKFFKPTRLDLLQMVCFQWECSCNYRELRLFQLGLRGRKNASIQRISVVSTGTVSSYAHTRARIIGFGTIPACSETFGPILLPTVRRWQASGGSCLTYSVSAKAKKLSR